MFLDTLGVDTLCCLLVFAGLAVGLLGAAAVRLAGQGAGR